MTRRSGSTLERVPTTVILTCSSSTGLEVNYDFLDGSITYGDVKLRNSFDYMLIDNIGVGIIQPTTPLELIAAIDL